MPPPPHPVNSSPRLASKHNAARQPSFFMDIMYPRDTRTVFDPQNPANEPFDFAPILHPFEFVRQLPPAPPASSEKCGAAS